MIHVMGGESLSGISILGVSPIGFSTFEILIFGILRTCQIVLSLSVYVLFDWGMSFGRPLWALDGDPHPLGDL